jgi:CheY-like chemotaxis protein
VVFASPSHGAQGLVVLTPNTSFVRIDEAVTDAEVAWTRLQTTRYQLLVVDHFLAESSGADLIARVRAEPAMQSIPILGISVGGKVARDAMLSAGVDVFLDKPVRVRDLLATLERLSRRGQARFAAPTRTGGAAPLDELKTMLTKAGFKSIEIDGMPRLSLDSTIGAMMSMRSSKSFAVAFEMSVVSSVIRPGAAGIVDGHLRAIELPRRRGAVAAEAFDEPRALQRRDRSDPDRRADPIDRRARIAGERERRCRDLHGA